VEGEGGREEEGGGEKREEGNGLTRVGHNPSGACKISATSGFQNFLCVDASHVILF
jgi:hypothetical protein